MGEKMYELVYECVECGHRFAGERFKSEAIAEEALKDQRYDYDTHGCKPGMRARAILRCYQEVEV